MNRPMNEISEHRMKLTHILFHILFAILMTGASIAILYVVHFTDMSPMDSSSYGVDDPISDLMSQIFWIFPIGIALTFLLKDYLLPAKVITIYSNGIGYGNKQWLWDDIKGFQEKRIRRYISIIPIGTSYEFRLRFNTGDKILIDGKYKNFKELASVLREEIGTRITTNNIQPY